MGENEVEKIVSYLLLLAIVGSICSFATVPSIRDVLRHLDNCDNAVWHKAAFELWTQDFHQRCHTPNTNCVMALGRAYLEGMVDSSD